MRYTLVLIALLIVGCSQTSTSSAPARATSFVPSSANSSSSRIVSSTPSPSDTRTVTASPASELSQTPRANPALLEIIAPEDESIVTESMLVIVGKTIPGAVVSINGNLLNVDITGKFQFALALDEGPNIIEIVASDMNGNEQNLILRVIYEP